MLSAPPKAGDRLGRYRLVEQVGSGGMGVVFLARDEQLERDVALKVLPEGLLADDASRAQFRKEALAVARLNHPNIAMAFDFGHEQGMDYLVTEYVPGQNLDEKLGQQALPQRRVLELGIELAAGLEAAHRVNVIHRDLKPGNIRINPDGQLKILDFGLAKVADPIEEAPPTSNLTANLSVSGTLPYMSPEQLRDEKVDARSDLWAAGAVLYEMATGKRAFPDRSSSRIIDSILHYDPVRPSLLNPGISPSLEAVILKALERTREDRYQSARDLRTDLSRVLAGEEIDVSLHRHADAIAARRVKWDRTTVLAFVVLGVLAAAFLVTYWKFSVAPRQQKILAVLPFDVVGQDPATSALGLGLIETVTAKLEQAGSTDSIQVISPRDLRDRGVRTAEDARRYFGTDYVLESSLQRSGSLIRINAYLVDSRTHRQLASRTITSDASDIFGLQDKVVTAALDMLPAEVSPQNRREVALRPDTQPAVYEYYIRGRGYLQEYEKPENIDSAIGEFEHALKLDPDYAPAYAGLGEAYWLGYHASNRGAEWLDNAAANCQKALTLSADVADAHTCLGNVLSSTGKYSEAAQQFQRAMELDPDNQVALVGLADAYESMNNFPAAEAAYQKAIHLRPKYWGTYESLGGLYFDHARYEDAAAMFRKVIEVAPDNHWGYAALGAAYFYQGRYAEAIDASRHSIELRPSVEAYSNLGAAYFYSHRFPEAAESCTQAAQLDDKDWLNWGNLGDALYWTKGRRAEASANYRKAIALARRKLEVNPRDGNTWAFVASYYAMLDDKQQAFDSLQKALAADPNNPEVMFRAALVYNHFNQSNEMYSWLKRAVDAGYSRTILRDTPEFTGLHNDPRFRALLQAS